MTIVKRFFQWLSRDMNKGGRGERPTTPRPPPPKGQGIRHSCCCHQSSEKDSVKE